VAAQHPIFRKFNKLSTAMLITKPGGFLHVAFEGV
jgi:hypothetical protein